MTIYAWSSIPSLGSKIQAVGSLAVLACAYHAIKKLGSDTQPELRYLPSKACADQDTGASKRGYFEGCNRLMKLVKVMVPKLWSNEALVSVRVVDAICEGSIDVAEMIFFWGT